jgi:hypothetical protein
MAITDAERHRLHIKLDEVLGEEDAAVLISHLPPSGWSDVARTHDLDQLEARINTQFAVVDERFRTMEARFDASLERALRQQTHRFLAGTGALVAIVATVQGIALNLVVG